MWRVLVLSSSRVYDGMEQVTASGFGRNEGRPFGRLVLMILGVVVDGRGEGKQAHLVGSNDMKELYVSDMQFLAGLSCFLMLQV